MGLQLCRLGWVPVEGERNWVGRALGEKREEGGGSDDSR